MQAFRESGAHGELMPKMARWATQASSTAWQVDVAPSWDEAVERMDANPRWIELDHPDEWARAKQVQRASKTGLTLPVPKRRAAVKGANS
jgi:hypothetical protein